MTRQQRFRVGTVAIALLVCVSAASVLYSGIKEKPSRSESFAKKIAQANEIEVFSISPCPPGEGEAADKRKRFHGWTVLGSTRLSAKEADEKLKLESVLAALSQAMSDPLEGAAKGCGFEPRHGLRIAAGAKKFDVVVCLACGDIDSYPGKGRLWLKNPGKKTLRQELNAALKEADIALAEGAEE